MCVQIADTILYNGWEYSFVNSSTERFIFHPIECGVEPLGSSTANYRGFYAEYTLLDGELILNCLFLDRNNNEETEIFGIQPVHYRYESGIKKFLGFPLPWTGWSDYNLYKLDALIPFTGGILIGRDWLCPSFWTVHDIQYFGQVHELIFDHGILQQAYNCSEAVRAFRDGLKSGSLTKDLEPIPNAPPADMNDWDERTNLWERQNAIKQQHRQRVLDAFNRCFQLKYKSHWI